MGNGIATNQLMKMVAGAINPGRPVANLYVSTQNYIPDMFSQSCAKVFYVESRRHRYLDQFSRRLEDGAIPQNSSPRHVYHSNLGDNIR